MPAGKSPNNAFILHKAKMSSVFNVFRGDKGIVGLLAIKKEHIAESVSKGIDHSWDGICDYWWLKIDGQNDHCRQNEIVRNNVPSMLS